jgi:lipopolysaccharide export LptBFGC system permease protein LptF
MLSLDLFKVAINSAHTQRLSAIGELNDRIIMPLFIPFLILLACFLIITNKDVINYNFLKIVIFASGFGAIILAEVLLDLSSKKSYASFILYAAPFVFFFINWILLNYFLNKENAKS